MKPREKVIVVFLIVSMLGVYGAVGSISLEGPWYVHGLISGDHPAQVPGWYWLSWNIDSAGNITVTSPIHDSLGNAHYTPSLGQFTVRAGRVIMAPNPVSFSGVVNSSGDFLAATATMAPGSSDDVKGYNLLIGVKQGTGYATADLAGTWRMHGLVSGDSPQWRGWVYGTVTMTSTGGLSYEVHNSSGDTNTGSATAQLASDGIYTISELTGSHGLMSADRQTVVWTSNDGGGGFSLDLMQKQSGASFSSPDLVGRWSLRMLTSGDAPQWTGWVYGDAEMDSLGAFFSSLVRSDGSSATKNGTVNISTDGVVAFAGQPSSHGVMSDDKELIVLTMNDGGGGYDLFVLIRAYYYPVHRFWSGTLRRHFYTTSEPEKQKLVNIYSHVWTYEDVAYYALPDGGQLNSVPVYRFWSGALSAHFYTSKESEKNKLIDNYSHVWTYEGVAFYAFPAGLQPSDTNAVYRFWSDTLNCHFYTISETEKNKLITNYSHVWTYEGIAWYAYP
jgi:hypothetical protein